MRLRWRSCWLSRGVVLVQTLRLQRRLPLQWLKSRLQLLCRQRRSLLQWLKSRLQLLCRQRRSPLRRLQHQPPPRSHPPRLQHPRRPRPQQPQRLSLQPPLHQQPQVRPQQPQQFQLQLLGVLQLPKHLTDISQLLKSTTIHLYPMTTFVNGLKSALPK